MADKIEKFVAKLSMKDTEIYRDIVKAILSHDLELYDVKKLSGHSNIYRVRKGRIRVIFQKNLKDVEIIDVGNRDENTYRKY